MQMLERTILLEIKQRSPKTVALLLACAWFLPVAVQAQTVTVPANLRFGRMIVGPTGGTVTMPTNNNTRTTTGAVTLLTGGGIGRGTINIAGTGGFNQVQIILPASVTLSNGSNTLNLVPTLNGAAIRNLVPGSFNTRYGGTITYPPGVVYGNYSGTMVVTLNFIL
jgi:hypothetical protein